MLAVGLITRRIAANPTFPVIIDGFFSGFSFLETVEDIEEWCKKFFSAFYNVGGSFVLAANSLKKQLQISLKKLNVLYKF